MKNVLMVTKYTSHKMCRLTISKCTYSSASLSASHQQPSTLSRSRTFSPALLVRRQTHAFGGHGPPPLPPPPPRPLATATLLPVSMDSALPDMSYKWHHIIWAAKYFPLIFSGSTLPGTQSKLHRGGFRTGEGVAGRGRACAGAPGLPLVCLARGSRPRIVL